MPPKLSQHINRWRWQLPVSAFALLVIHQWVVHTWLVNVSEWGHFASQVFFYGAAGSVMAGWTLNTLRLQIAQVTHGQGALAQAHAALAETNRRLEFLIRLNQRLAQAEDEEALIEAILELALKLVPAAGCSLIRFDQRGRPLPAIHRGSLDPQAFEAWAAHLSATETSATCKTCSANRVTDVVSCPLVMRLATVTTVSQVHCLALTRGERAYGLLNLYLPDPDPLDAQAQKLLTTMADEMALAFESQQLQSRELAMLHRLQQVQRRSTLQGDLEAVLTHTIEALDAAGGALFLLDAETDRLELLVQAGQPPQAAPNLVEGLVRGARAEQVPLIINNLAHAESAGNGQRSLLVAPLHCQDRTLGSLVLWGAQPDLFTRRRGRLVAILAGQISLRVENQRLYGQAEHQAILTERARLAREIHDGLAQTMGYLKLRAAQTVGWLEGGAIERVGDGLREIQGLLAGAYVDTREAIDGLRQQPGAGAPGAWLGQVLSGFESLSGVQVNASAPPELSLPPEVGTQLLRIVQEALSNVRKHAQASQVKVEWRTSAHALTLCIADDGRGFDPVDVPPIFRHGLHIMRERAELLDADLKITSCPGAGTEVALRLPLADPKGLRRTTVRTPLVPLRSNACFLSKKTTTDYTDCTDGKGESVKSVQSVVSPFGSGSSGLGSWSGERDA